MAPAVRRAGSGGGPGPLLARVDRHERAGGAECAEQVEASLASGGTWLQTFRKVLLPLLMPGFVAGWIYISIIALRELSTSILLYSYDSTVLSIMAFDLWEGGQYTYVCALGVMMVLVLITMAYVARKLGAKVGIAE